ncbi:enterochelin esterase [Actinoplanes italicus]|uniref:Enterochelin esterase family protein n=1 Tax=Actinoplanes italicus TaxID=113567 RepID=A0A2T0KF06_9ACTN|nr:alpha/beta hydrolase-fold protein [Actinoplanes italicus]PRX21925.1 enterochelin esterase family protein [Actinoplanes italicus]GIE29658.1 enterochelin esterase [Actinoplanes italicus]
MSNPFVQKLSTGEWSPERFRRHLAETGAPLVERVLADEVEVTFVDEPGDDTTVTLSVVIGPTIGLNRIDTQFTPVPGTPFRSLTLRMRSDLRFSYVFTRGGQQVPDPFNPPPRFSECSVERFSGASVAVLPDAVPLPWLDQAEAQPAPAMESAVLASGLLGNERRIWVSMPPGELPDGTALPFVIHLDGTPEHSAPSVRDALVRAGLIRPCVVVLVDQLGSQRYKELLCDPVFSRMLAEELVPWLHDRYPLSRDPGDVALAGESFGGLCAGWTALHHPATFGNAILQSPSCGYHPGLRWGTGAGELLRRTPVPMLIADCLAAEPAPVRVFHDAGELESSNTHSRWLDHVLTQKGYDTVYREFAGGHDYAWWRGLFADALRWCFPSTVEAGATKH